MSDTSDLYFSPASLSFLFFFFNDPATTEIYTLSLHDALPIFGGQPDAVRELHRHVALGRHIVHRHAPPPRIALPLDRKSTRLNSSHTVISYAVFCLKKKKKKIPKDNNDKIHNQNIISSIEGYT